MTVKHETEPSRRVGLFNVQRNEEELSLRLDNKGEVSIKSCLLFAFTMVFLLVMALLSVTEMAQAPNASWHSMDDPSRLFAPQENHFGFLWLVSSLFILVAMPLYLRHVYQSTLVYTFRRRDNTFLRSRKIVTRLSRIENICLREERDSDSVYLNVLSVIYNDGLEMIIQSGYEEREIMNLANEMSTFIGVPVIWK